MLTQSRLRILLTVLEKFMGLLPHAPKEELREEDDAGHQEDNSLNSSWGGMQGSGPITWCEV